MERATVTHIEDLGRLEQPAAAEDNGVAEEGPVGAVAHLASFREAKRQHQLLAASASGAIRVWRSDGARQAPCHALPVVSASWDVDHAPHALIRVVPWGILAPSFFVAGKLRMRAWSEHAKPVGLVSRGNM